MNGWYTVFRFIANNSSIAELERLFRINDDIIKFMTVKREPSEVELIAEDLDSLSEIKRNGFKISTPTSIPAKTEQKIIDAQDIFLSFIN